MIERLHRAADHIELRMIDVNPMEPSGVELCVLEFCRFFLLWCAFGSDFAAITLGLTKSYSNIADNIRHKNKAV